MRGVDYILVSLLLLDNCCCCCCCRHRDIKQGEEVMVDYTSSYWRPLGQALMIEQQKYARSALLQHEKVDRQLEQAVTQGLLSQQQVHAALAFNPDLEQIKQYKGE